MRTGSESARGRENGRETDVIVTVIARHETAIATAIVNVTETENARGSETETALEEAVRRQQQQPETVIVVVMIESIETAVEEEEVLKPVAMPLQHAKLLKRTQQWLQYTSWSSER